VLSGLRADGPGFFHVGRYVLFVFVTGDPTDWPDSPFDAWSFIPERIYLAEQLRHASGSGRRRAVPIDRAHTLIQETAQPGRLDGRHLLARGERIVAELALFRARRVKVGATALERGILIGRAARCDSGGALEDQRLSRVHLLIVAVREQIYAIDTASTNGSRLADEPGHLRVRALPDRAELELADVAQIGWRRSCFEDGPAAWG
jgi:hypothetical protein